MMLRIITILLVAFAQLSFAQSPGESYRTQSALRKKSLLKEYPARNIGPTVQGGRVVDIEANPSNPQEFYLGFASGGIFKTTNNGMTFLPIFDQQDALGIGDFALAPSNPQIIVVGTGEKNSSRSSYAGSGVYKTMDGGKTWNACGLESSHHISRIIIHPTLPETFWVAVIGSLYTKNESRGVFKTIDGGKTWTKSLYINDSTGVIDLMIDPSNPNHLLAASWERSRSAGNFKGHGPGSSIYSSTDGGNTWKITDAGLPKPEVRGRMGFGASGNSNLVYLILDNQTETKVPTPVVPGKISLGALSKMTVDQIAALDSKKLTEVLQENGFPDRYTAESIKAGLKSGKFTPTDLGNYFGEDANRNLFDSKITGAEVYKSADGGNTWKLANTYPLDNVFYTYGYYFAEMKVSPANPDLIYFYGVPMLKSTDAGATWHRLDTLRGIHNIHVDHHALWINPANSSHMLLGNDGGVYQTYDEGANWLHLNSIPAGQFYTVSADMEKPYNVYGGLQDNGVLMGPETSVPNQSEHWKEISGGDGMYVFTDPRNKDIVYSGYQFGNYYRYDLEKNESQYITPAHDIGKNPYRWNWRTPLYMSKFNPDILYIGAQKVLRSLDKGNSWTEISPDLTRNLKQGNIPFSTLTSLEESPIKYGLIYAGSDDGLLHVSKDGGASWNNISAGLPEGKWISSIDASSHEEGTVFVSLNGYRLDDFKTYLYRSKDYGKTWESVKGNLPESVANVIAQDPVQPNLLYAGLDLGTFVSMNNGQQWEFMNEMLNVPAYDLMIHPRDNDLIVGTHGRSVFIAVAKPLQEVAAKGIATPVHVFAPKEIRFNANWGKKSVQWGKESKPAIRVMYYLGSEGIPVAQVLSESGVVLQSLYLKGTPGFHEFTWDGRIKKVANSTKKPVKSGVTVQESPEFIQPGTYKIRITTPTGSAETTLVVK